MTMSWTGSRRISSLSSLDAGVMNHHATARPLFFDYPMVIGFAFIAHLFDGLVPAGQGELFGAGLFVVDLARGDHFFSG